MSLKDLGAALLKSRESRNRKNIRFFVQKYLDRVIRAQLNAILILDRRYNIVDNDTQEEIQNVIEYIENLTNRLRWDAPSRDEMLDELHTIRMMLDDIGEGDDLIQGKIESTDQISRLASFRIERCKKFIDTYMIPNRLFTIDLKKDLYGGHSSATRKRRR